MVNRPPDPPTIQQFSTSCIKHISFDFKISWLASTCPIRAKACLPRCRTTVPWSRYDVDAPSSSSEFFNFPAKCVTGTALVEPSIQTVSTRQCHQPSSQSSYRSSMTVHTQVNVRSRPFPSIRTNPHPQALLSHRPPHPSSNQSHKLHSRRRMLHTDCIEQCRRDPNKLRISDSMNSLRAANSRDHIYLANRVILPVLAQHLGSFVALVEGSKSTIYLRYSAIVPSSRDHDTELH